MKTAYLNSAQQGKNNWLRYLAGILIIIFAATAGAALPFLGLQQYVSKVFGIPKATFLPESIVFPGIDPFMSFAALSIGDISLLAGIIIVLRYLHKREVLSLFTSRSTISWLRILLGASVYFLLMVIVSLIDYAIFPENYTVNFKPDRFWIFMGLVFLTIPLQALGEELLARGYVMQSLSLWMNAWKAVLLSSFIFCALHFGNPDLKSSPYIGALSLFIVGMFFALITIRDGSLELAIGVHVVHNISSYLLIAPSQKFAGIELPAVLAHTAEMYSLKMLLMQIATFILFWLIVFKWLPRKGQKITNEKNHA